MGDRRGMADDDRPTVDLGAAVGSVEPGSDDLGPDPTAMDAPVVHAYEATRDRRVAGLAGLTGLTQAEAGTMRRPLQRPTDPVHHLPTQQLAVDAARPRTGSMSRALDEKTATTSPALAMRHDEIERSRVFLRVAFFLSAGGAVIAFMTSGDPIAQRSVGIGSLLGVVGAAWMYWRIRDDVAYDQHTWIVPGVLLVVGAMSGLYYWGVASPVAAMMVYGIYFFALGSSRTMTMTMYLMTAIGHGLLFVAMITGLLHDRGLVSITNLRAFEQVAILTIVEFLYFVAFITARISQRVTLDAMSRLEAATRGMAQRDAMLAEARAELDRALKIGGPGRFSDQIVGSFRLGILIGRGGMGEVYEAHATTGKGEAAVKLLHPGTLADPTSVARFVREAQMASKLDTPFVVRVLEVGTTAGEIPFLAMERLRGFDLAHQLRRQRRLHLPAANEVAQHVALGLDAARAAGIVHRDLKPHNVFNAEMGSERCWKILDFGVSKAGGSGTLTKGGVVGTPAYMAPEQARGEEVDHRADVYSLAAILYRCTTGHPAFTGKDVPTTLYDVVYRIPTQPSLLALVPADIDRVLALGLAKATRDRFATARELAAWFELAITSSLDGGQRARADDLISRQPWGTRAFAAASPAAT